MIFIFRQYDSQKNIIIYAESYLEAKEVLYSLNPWADRKYNIFEYKMYEVDKEKYADILGIDKDMIIYPRIISETEFFLIKSSQDHILLDEQFKNMHNTKVLSKGYANEKSLMSTSEFVTALKENADYKQIVKRQIKKMLSIVGDVWKLTYTTRYNDSNGMIKNTANIYGLSRRQALELYNKQQYKEEYENIVIEPIIQSNYRTLFELENNDFSQEDINEYNILVNYMKKYNIKKFPFDTQTEDNKFNNKNKAGI